MLEGVIRAWVFCVSGIGVSCQIVTAPLVVEVPMTNEAELIAIVFMVSVSDIVFSFRGADSRSPD
jgi:formate hydrogenlyase subunit 4